MPVSSELSNEREFETSSRLWGESAAILRSSLQLLYEGTSSPEVLSDLPLVQSVREQPEWDLFSSHWCQCCLLPNNGPSRTQPGHFLSPILPIRSRVVLWSCSLDFKVAWLCFLSKTDRSLQLMNVSHLSRLASSTRGAGTGLLV